MISKLIENQSIIIVLKKGKLMENLGLGIAVLGIVNGMIGGASLVIPLLALHAGYLLILPITILFGPHYLEGFPSTLAC